MTTDEALIRPVSDGMDALLGRRLAVLDDGFVRVVDYMGTDASIVQAARVSYGAGTKTAREDRGLIRYLMRHRHTTPFEMCEIKLHVRVPMDAWRQWIRHRTANVNEYSTRYSIAIDAAQATDPLGWRTQSKANRQGGDALLPEGIGRELTRAEDSFHREARQVYENRLAKGVAREQARKDLPLSTYTEAYWKIDLHNLFHFLSLRMDLPAQAEIRAYATTIGERIVSEWCPIAWEAFVDYRLGAGIYSRVERELIRALVAGDGEAAISVAIAAQYLDEDGSATLTNRERSECEAKLADLGLVAPWLKDE